MNRRKEKGRRKKNKNINLAKKQPIIFLLNLYFFSITYLKILSIIFNYIFLILIIYLSILIFYIYNLDLNIYLSF